VSSFLQAVLSDTARRSHLFKTLLAILRIDRTYHKVFCIGFNKTGTSSINTVLCQLGYDGLHDETWPKEHRYKQLLYDAFSDGFPRNFIDFDRIYPRSRFILNVRNLDEWLDSRLEHIRYQVSQEKLTPSRYWDFSSDAVKHWVVRRNQHHAKVMQRFASRPNDLLVLNYIRNPDAAAQVAQFLNKPEISNKPYTRPIPKTRKQGGLKNKDMIHTCLRELGIP